MGAVLLTGAVAATGEPPLRFDRVSLERGLSQASVYAVLQDRVGFLWVGGEYGLNRYDGYDFRLYAHDPDDPGSLSTNEVRCLAEDSLGQMWVGTLDGGLNRYDPARDAFVRFRHDPDDPASLADDDVRAVAESPGGDIWVATGQGLDRLRPGTTTFEHHRHDPVDPTSLGHNNVSALALDAEGRLWVGTRGGGLSVLAGEPGTFAHVRADPADRGTLVSDTVRCLLATPDGSVWVGTDLAGLHRVDAATLEVERVAVLLDSGAPSGTAVGALVRDPAGRLWVGCEGGTLVRLDPGTGVARPFCVDAGDPCCLSSTWAGALWLDRSEILWVGTSFDGLNRVDLKGSPFQHHLPVLEGPDAHRARIVFTVLEDREGVLWVGTHAGLERVDPHTGATTWYRPESSGSLALPARPVYELHEGRDGSLWLGTWGGGACRLDPLRRELETYRHDPADPDSLASDVVMGLLEDRRGQVWVATWGDGLDRLDPATGRCAHLRASPGGLASNYLQTVVEDADGVLWVGTTGGGLSRVDPTTGAVDTYRQDPSDPASLSDDRVSWIHPARDGSLWIATAGGLNRLDPTSGRFSSYRTRDGLPSDAVTGVLEDAGGRLWAAHFKGLSRLDPSTGAVTSFDADDGLQSNEFNAGAAFRATSGEMLFGGINGVTRFHPDQVLDNPHPPHVVITSVEVYGEDLERSDVSAGLVRLHHTQDFLAFQYVGLESTAPAKNHYAYRLEGVDRSFVDAGTRRLATYAHLAPGRYVFRVKAANSSGRWSPQGASLVVVIEPPFWQTWWFRSVLLAFLAGVLAAAYAWRTRSLRRRLAAQERLVAERTAALAEANRELEALSVRDPLTGVANRRRLDEHLDQEWRRSLRFARPLSVIMVDVDDFKAYNDAYGHQAGDLCLQRVSSALAELVQRPGDLLARYGGEELVAVMSETASAIAAAQAERMRQAVSALAIAHPDPNGTGQVSVSLGVATAVAAPEREWRDLVAAADRALYEAKRSGKNRVVVGAVP